MFRSFDYRNITFKQDPQGEGLVISGDITNKSGKNYHSVVFRVILFIKSTPIGNTTITINGFANNQTKRFEKQMGELQYKKVAPEITYHEIYPESAY